MSGRERGMKPAVEVIEITESADDDGEFPDEKPVHPDEDDEDEDYKPPLVSQVLI